MLSDFHLAKTALHNIYVFRADFGDPFDNLPIRIIYNDLADIVNSYVSKNEELLERQIWEARGRESVKGHIGNFFLNEKLGELYLH